jgi:molecular chaperone GrpE
MSKHSSAKHESSGERPCKAAHVEPGVAAAQTASGEDVALPTEASDLAAQSQAEIAALKDRELRARAELENYRKRAARELSESLRYANLPIIRDLLPVLDNVERAIDAAEKNADTAGLLEGLRLVQQQLLDVFQRHHCQRIEALHAPFDPHLHHAILQQPSDEFPPNTVLVVTQSGYQLHDRVVRASQVIVSASP